MKPFSIVHRMSACLICTNYIGVHYLKHTFVTLSLLPVPAQRPCGTFLTSPYSHPSLPPFSLSLLPSFLLSPLHLLTPLQRDSRPRHTATGAAAAPSRAHACLSHFQSVRATAGARTVPALPTPPPHVPSPGQGRTAQTRGAVRGRSVASRGGGMVSRAQASAQGNGGGGR